MKPVNAGVLGYDHFIRDQYRVFNALERNAAEGEAVVVGRVLP